MRAIYRAQQTPAKPAGVDLESAMLMILTSRTGRAVRPGAHASAA